MKLTVVRHGETIENQKQIIQGQTQGTLTPKGIEQAKVLAKLLAEEVFDIVYCSDLQRCVDTAAEIMKHHKDTPIEYTKQIREMNQPRFAGQPWGSETWDYPERLLTRRAPGGESFKDVWKRIEKFTNDTLAKHSKDNVLVVTHGGPVRGFLVLNHDAKPEETLNSTLYPVDNCDVWRWEVTKPLTLPDL